MQLIPLVGLLLCTTAGIALANPTSLAVAQMGLVGEWGRDCTQDDVRWKFFIDRSGNAFMRVYERATNRTIVLDQITAAARPNVSTIRLDVLRSGVGNIGQATFAVEENTLKLSSYRGGVCTDAVANGKNRSGIDLPRLNRCDGGRIAGYLSDGSESSYSAPSGCATESGYAVSSGYSAPSGYAVSSGYSVSSGYAASSGHAVSSGYSAPSGYAVSSGYSASSGYAASSGHAVSSGFSAPSGYAASSGYSAPGGRTASSGYSASSGHSALGGRAVSSGTSVSSGYAATSGISTASGRAASSGYAVSSGQSSPSSRSVSGGSTRTGASTLSGRAVSNSQIVPTNSGLTKASPSNERTTTQTPENAANYGIEGSATSSKQSDISSSSGQSTKSIPSIRLSEAPKTGLYPGDIEKKVVKEAPSSAVSTKLQTAVNGALARSPGYAYMTPALAAPLKNPQNASNCVYFLRDELGVKLPYGLEDWKGKSSLIDPSLMNAPRQGDVAMIPYVDKKTGEAIGHVAMVTSVTATSISIVEANFSSGAQGGRVTGRIAYGTQLDDAIKKLNITGFYRPQ